MDPATFAVVAASRQPLVVLGEVRLQINIARLYIKVLGIVRSCRAFDYWHGFLC
jgi:hypothetical protein